MRYRKALLCCWTATLALFSAPTAHASGPGVCTWGGSPDAVTGHVRLTPGLSNVPSAGPIALAAEGPLGRACTGNMRFVGEDLPGAQCLLFINHGSVSGLSGVAWFLAAGNVGQQGLLYGPDGSVVGSYQVTVPPDTLPALRSECNSSQGITEATFSATVQLGVIG